MRHTDNFHAPVAAFCLRGYGQLWMIEPVSVLSVILYKKRRELLFERFDLWTITNLDVGILWVVERVILVVVLGAVKAF